MTLTVATMSYADCESAYAQEQMRAISAKYRHHSIMNSKPALAYDSPFPFCLSHEHAE